MKELTMLFTPIKIGTMEVRNRIVMAAMATNFADPEGRLTDRQIAYYAARARGGAGIISTGVTEIDPAGKGTAFSPAIWDDSLIPAWKKLADALHAHGAKLVPQLHHAGRETMSALTGLTPVAPSPIPCPVCKEMPRELTLEEIEDLIEKFGEGARRAREAGCDGVELHGAHGYLIAQFMSPISNRRQDEYGGSLDARLKFAIEVIKRVRRKVGRDFPVIFRIVGEEMVDGGYTIEQTKIICRILVEAGVDAFHISRGGSYGAIRWICPPHGSPMGLNTVQAAAVKSVVDVPVIVVGRLNDPVVAEHFLEQGAADMVAMGRPFIADPDWPKKAAAGNLDDIIPCISCNQGCLLNVLAGLPLTCLSNPTVGKEVEMAIVRAKKLKKVLVVGGGPAGLEAARVAALRGHNVTLYEKEGKLGGQFYIAANPPTKQELVSLIKHLAIQVKKAGGTIEMGKEVTPELAGKLKADVVIVATGGAPVIPADISGTDKPHVVSAHDLLAGKAIVGDKVAIIGGGEVGCEAADYIGERAALQITVLEMLEDVALDMPPWNKEFLMERLNGYGVTIITSAKVKAILDDGVVFTRNGKEESIRGVNSVVLALGTKPVDNLSKKLQAKAAEVHVIGDAKEPRRALDAIAEASALARQI